MVFIIIYLFSLWFSIEEFDAEKIKFIENFCIEKTKNIKDRFNAVSEDINKKIEDAKAYMDRLKESLLNGIKNQRDQLLDAVELIKLNDLKKANKNYEAINKEKKEHEQKLNTNKNTNQIKAKINELNDKLRVEIALMNSIHDDSKKIIRDNELLFERDGLFNLENIFHDMEATHLPESTSLKEKE